MDATLPDPEPHATFHAICDQVKPIMQAAWIDAGYTAPNNVTYPWLWLWDSCFHSLIWHTLGRNDRAITELRSVFANQNADGFVPHMGYQLDPQRPVELWGREGCSSITQPPMYGHAIAELNRAGVAVPAHLVDNAAAGLRFLLEVRQRDASGLLTVVHPWETGCDDSPRWDHFCPGGFELARWRAQKMALLDTITFSNRGAPTANHAFGAAPVSFSALTAFNGRELATITNDRTMREAADELAQSVAARWDPQLATWVDAGPAEATSGRVRTADALTALLVVDEPNQRRSAFAALVDPDAYGGRYGPRGVHAGEAVYDPAGYWRGPVWPQLAYLLCVAAERESGRGRGVDSIVRGRTIDGARRSGFAEYWDGDTGIGGGAVPQSWTGLAVVLAAAATSG